MKFTLSWLKEYLETDASLDEISEKLTAIGLEVEEIIDNSAKLQPFNIAQIIEAKPHPDADKLQICRVKTADQDLQIVCGASNARKGINVVLAPVGSLIPTNNMKIKASKIRGIESNGMLCSASELGLGADDSGIIEMPANDNDIGKNYSDLRGLSDPLIEIAITPNRGDCLGVYGIARDLAATGIGSLKKLIPESIDGKFNSPISVSIEDKDTCKKFIGRYFKNVENKESPEWLKIKLKSVGLNPISALVDITNYISLAFGRPLHVYDADKISEKIIARKAKTNEKITALDDKEYQLDDSICIISDDKKPLSVAGIIGGKESGCTENTKNVLLEIAYFDANAVACTGRKLGIITDSRYRFERNVDPDFLQIANNIATKLIIDICGGEVSNLVEAGELADECNIIEFDFDYVKQRSGIEISKQKSAEILQSLGFEIDANKIKVPSWRKDVEGKVDIVEEIVRIYGYENIPEIEAFSKPISIDEALSPEQNRLRIIKNSLISIGLVEAISWSFMDSKKAKNFSDDNDSLKLLNPISSELGIMRPSILPNLIDAVGKNEARGNGNLALFESGLIFESTDIKGQRNCVAGVRSGSNWGKNIYSDSRKVDLFDAKSDCLTALEAANIPVDNLKITTDTPEYYHPGRSGVLKLGKEIIAFFGEIHPSILSLHDVNLNIVGFEIFLDKLPKIKKKKTTKNRLDQSEYQASVRDFAFIINKQVNAETIIKSIKSADKKLLKEVNIFDVYEGDKIEKDKKSVAISIKIQSFDKTLAEEDLNNISDKIIKSITNIGGTLRGI